jgi:hypothetical protein
MLSRPRRLHFRQATLEHPHALRLHLAERDPSRCHAVAL